MDLDVAGSNPVTHPSSSEPAYGTDGRRAFVAQLDRATDFESVGRGFDSLRTQFFFVFSVFDEYQGR